MKRAALGLLIVIAYMAGRSRFYAACPVERPCGEIPAFAPSLEAEAARLSAEDAQTYRDSRLEFHREKLLSLLCDDPARWSARDLAMSLPRMAVLAICVFVLGCKEFLAQWRGSPAGWEAAAWVVSCGVLFVFISGGLPTAPARLWIMGALSSAPVALWEETCFRGVLFSGLRGRLGAAATIFLSSLAFMLMHYGARPVLFGPGLFAFGAVCASARERGMGLSWLCLAHWAVDAAVYPRFFSMPFGSERVDFNGWVVLLLLALSFVATARAARWDRA